MTELRFTLPDVEDPPRLAVAVASGFAVESESTETVRRRYLDSFDWRLHRAGLVLEHEDDRWRLRRLGDDGVEAEAPAGDGTWPRFAADFPTTDRLRKRLAKLLKMRAVVHLATVAGERRSWRVLNTDRKTVLRLELVSLRPEKPAAAAVLHAITLRPLRGYEDTAARVGAEAAARGLAPLDRCLLDEVLAAAGLAPESYSSSFHADLTPTQTALEAAVCVSRALLSAVRRNEPGVRQDIDTEFLHDFRVAVRRQRSALTVFKDVFDPGAVEAFKGGFSALGRHTGPLRDLDVYLLDENRYRGLVPASLRPGLDFLFDDLRAQRERALGEVRLALASPAYRELLAAWDAFLADPRPGAAADRPAIDLARDRLERRHRGVLKKGRAIGARTPDQALHRLRIQCKKLRYLLEFFAPLFPGEDGAALVKHLKGLQDNLGEFNDLVVQQQMLRTAIADLPPRRKSSLATAAALGGLVTALHARRQVVRGDFEQAFAGFAGPAATRRIERLTGGAEEATA